MNNCIAICLMERWSGKGSDCIIAEQVYHKTIQQLQDDLEKAQADVEYYQKEAQLAKLGELRPNQEATQLKKTILALQRHLASLEERLSRCTCSAGSTHGCEKV